MSLDILWGKLVDYMKKNVSAFSKIQYNKEENSIKVDYTNENQFLDIIKAVDPSNFLQKNLIRNIRIKTRFNPETKSLEIVDDPDSNEITYSVTCNKQIKFKNSIYFDEEAVSDYSNDYADCTFSVACVLYKVKCLDIETAESQINTENIFLCYNSESEKLDENTYEDSLNSGSLIDLSGFIAEFNGSKNYENIFNARTDESERYVYTFSDVKFAVSSFKMPNKSEKDFLNFSSYSSRTIYDNFLSSLEKNSETIYQGIEE